MDLEALDVDQTGAVLHITLNRPALRNAMSRQMVTELRQVLRVAQDRTGQPDAVRVVVLRGAGGHFCAGADLKDMAVARMSAMQQDRDQALDPLAQVNAEFGELCLAYAQTPLAVVAVLEGSVMGGGLGLACVADVVLACDTTVCRLPETALGLVPAQIAPFLVERLGYSQARRLAVTGGNFNAEQALAIGLVHAVHAPQALDAALASLLGQILACAPLALGATKALMARARLNTPADLIEPAARIFSRAAQSAEALEGTAAFLQKRKPNWAPP